MRQEAVTLIAGAHPPVKRTGNRGRERYRLRCSRIPSQATRWVGPQTEGVSANNKELSEAQLSPQKHWHYDNTHAQ